jgi:hypothetical protein
MPMEAPLDGMLNGHKYESLGVRIRKSSKMFTGLFYDPVSV